MNNKKHIDADIIKLLYYKYRDYVIPIAVFCLSWFVFFQFAIPQIQNFFANKDAVDANEQTLAVLTQNYNLISLQNDNELTNLLDTANHALPATKDFAGILNAISAASATSGVVVNDYSFQIGSINGITAPSGTGNQSVQLSLTIKGSINETKEFLSALSKQLPLSEITSVNISNGATAAITANFFFADATKATFVPTSSLVVLSPSQKKILQDLGKNAVGQISAPIQKIATPTAALSPAPVSSASSQ